MECTPKEAFCVKSDRATIPTTRKFGLIPRRNHAPLPEKSPKTRLVPNPKPTKAPSNTPRYVALTASPHACCNIATTAASATSDHTRYASATANTGPDRRFKHTT
jgi:hypothetical protein